MLRLAAEDEDEEEEEEEDYSELPSFAGEHQYDDNNNDEEDDENLPFALNAAGIANNPDNELILDIYKRALNEGSDIFSYNERRVRKPGFMTDAMDGTVPVEQMELMHQRFLTKVEEWERDHPGVNLIEFLKIGSGAEKQLKDVFLAEEVRRLKEGIVFEFKKDNGECEKTPGYFGDLDNDQDQTINQLNGANLTADSRRIKIRGGVSKKGRSVKKKRKRKGARRETLADIEEDSDQLDLEELEEIDREARLDAEENLLLINTSVTHSRSTTLPAGYSYISEEFPYSDYASALWFAQDDDRLQIDMPPAYCKIEIGRMEAATFTDFGEVHDRRFLTGPRRRAIMVDLSGGGNGADRVVNWGGRPSLRDESCDDLMTIAVLEHLKTSEDLASVSVDTFNRLMSDAVDKHNMCDSDGTYSYTQVKKEKVEEEEMQPLKNTVDYDKFVNFNAYYHNPKSFSSERKCKANITTDSSAADLTDDDPVSDCNAVFADFAVSQQQYNNTKFVESAAVASFDSSSVSVVNDSAVAASQLDSSSV
eukprot:gene23583-29811_t